MEWYQIIGILILAQVFSSYYYTTIRHFTKSQPMSFFSEVIDSIFGGMFSPFFITLGIWLILGV